MNELFTQECGELVRVELEPCPKCGSPALENLQYKRFVNCSNQECKYGEAKTPYGIHFDVWNYRVVDVSLWLENAELRQQIRELRVQSAELNAQLAKLNLKLQDAYDRVEA